MSSAVEQSAAIKHPALHKSCYQISLLYCIFFKRFRECAGKTRENFHYQDLHSSGDKLGENTWKEWDELGGGKNMSVVFVVQIKMELSVKMSQRESISIADWTGRC